MKRSIIYFSPFEKCKWGVASDKSVKTNNQGMKYSITLLCTILLYSFVIAQDMQPLLAEAAQLEKNLKENEALEIYQSVLKLQPANNTALLRAAELSGRIGSRFKDSRQKASAYGNARYYAERALKQKENLAEAYYVMSLSSLQLASVNKGKDKAAYLRDMKFYADSSLLFNPSHAGSLYLTGKWNIEIEELNPAEKTAIKVLFGGMPKASLQDAIQYFEKARIANQWMLVNYLDLAKAYVKDHRTDRAIEVLNKMVKMPPRTGDDEALKGEGRKLLASLQ